MKQQPNHSANINETIIATGVQVRGNLRVEASLWLDGEVDGSINAGGDVSLGATGLVKGNVSGATVAISGRVTGNIKASVKLIILAEGQVLGDVDVASIAIEDGGVLIGQVRMPEPIEPSSINEADSDQ